MTTEKLIANAKNLLTSIEEGYAERSPYEAIEEMTDMIESLVEELEHAHEVSYDQL